MLQSVDVGDRFIENYRGIASDELLDELHHIAEDLQGLRVLHINATPYGGGVAELLRSVVPLLNNLGLVAEWKIISGDQNFFQVTKDIHNALQGGKDSPSEDDRTLYIQTVERNAELIDEVYDVVFVHDPQPVPVPSLRGRGDSLWIWRCHIDTSSPNPDVWAFLREWITAYDAAVFTLDEFVPPDFPVKPVEIIPPAIDPLSPKNFPLQEKVARQVLGWIGVNLDTHLITQVARFDPWKDPLGVIEAYHMVRDDISPLQLALVGSMALDDPEGWDVYKRIENESKRDPNIHVFTNLTGIGNIEVNAFQSLSDVVVQKSIREGFGLVVSEALWKGTPVVAGRAGGIPLQMADGAGGYLVNNVEECAQSIIKLLKNRDVALKLAQEGKERVQQHFLLPKLLLNELNLIKRLTAGRPLVKEGWKDCCDHVCGMVVHDSATAPSAEFGGRTYVFCSKFCRHRFLEHPEHYLR
jgi:trehalose synthase